MCELIGAYSLNILAQKHSMEKTLGFTEMTVFKQNSKQKTCKILSENALKITIQANKKVINF